MSYTVWVLLLTWELQFVLKSYINVCCDTEENENELINYLPGQIKNLNISLLITFIKVANGN